MPQASAGTLTIMTGVQAQDDGIALAGTMRSANLGSAAISTRIREFKWEPPKISCGAASLALVAAFMDSTDGFVLLSAAAIVDNTGTSPLYLCGWNIIPNSDPLGVFPAAAILVDAGPAGISLSVNSCRCGRRFVSRGVFSDRRQHDGARTGICRADPAFALVRPTGKR
jgi:hypothetical protein